MPYLLKIMLVCMPEVDTILLNVYPNCYIYAHKQHMDTHSQTHAPTDAQANTYTLLLLV